MPILNQHKAQLLSRIDIYVDDQRDKEPTWMWGHDLRQSLTQITTSLIRVRPWFEPGVWGGSWMKSHLENLAKDTVNYAWSFELIAPENGIILCDEESDLTLEFSFDLLLYHNNEALMGDECAQRFGHEFPIRFEFWTHSMAKFCRCSVMRVVNIWRDILVRLWHKMSHTIYWMLKKMHKFIWGFKRTFVKRNLGKD